MIIEKQVHARAGLAGNPSDGYFGKTVSVEVKNFRARVTLFESPELRIEPNARDLSVYRNLEDLIADIHLSGYYGGIRLIKASIKKFHEHLRTHGTECPGRNFTIRYDSDIPLRVGLAGSSAIINATLLALFDFYEVRIAKEYLPTLALKVETEELGIAAGLQDRVVQVYGGCVYMDFERNHLEEFQYGIYEALDPALLPPLYVAYREVLSEGTEVVHNDLRARWERGEEKVRAGMEGFAQIAESFRAALLAGDAAAMADAMDRNFDLRASLIPISRANWDLVNAARNAGASAKFCGSGGAIVGIYRDASMFADLERSMRAIDARVVRVEP